MRPLKELLNGAVLISTPRFGDDRGEFMVTYESDQAAALGLVEPFVQDNQSVSTHANTLRGIHLQLAPFEQGKLVRVLRGSILDVIVDLRPGSESHGEHESIELQAGSGEQLWVPRGFGHGFCTLEPDTEVFYKVDNTYNPAAERTLAWDDPTLGIEWPVDHGGPVLSDKDAVGLSFAEIVSDIDQANKGEAQ